MQTSTLSGKSASVSLFCSAARAAEQQNARTDTPVEANLGGRGRDFRIGVTRTRREDDELHTSDDAARGVADLTRGHLAATDMTVWQSVKGTRCAGKLKTLFGPCYGLA